MNIVEEYKKKMQTAPDEYLPGNESDIVDELLANPPDEIDAILEWILAEHKGYVEPRARAGRKFLERNPVQGWQTLERLISSNDPDDRDTAITVLERIGDANKYHLAKPLLKDPYPYLQFEAAELLASIYPNEVSAVLRELTRHETEVWVREKSKELLLKMGKSA